MILNGGEIETGTYPQPSHRPNFLYSTSLQSRLCFSVLSASFPFSEARGDPLPCFEGESFRVALNRDDGESLVELRTGGSDRRYQPPVKVRAISWYSGTGPRELFSSWVATLTQVTTHFSSSGSSTSDDLFVEEIEMCADCTGMRYCA